MQQTSYSSPNYPSLCSAKVHSIDVDDHNENNLNVEEDSIVGHGDVQTSAAGGDHIGHKRAKRVFQIEKMNELSISNGTVIVESMQNQVSSKIT